VPGVLSGSGSLIVFAPARALADGQYRLQTSGITDVAGSPVAPVSSTFTVAAAVVTASPRLPSSTPASGAVGVPVTSTIALNFSRPMSAVSAAQLHVIWQGRQIPGAMLTQDSTVTFTPTVPLPGAATIYVSGPVADLAGVGDAAYTVSIGAGHIVLDVRKGQTTFSTSVLISGASNDQLLDKEKTLAGLILGRI